MGHDSATEVHQVLQARRAGRSRSTPAELENPGVTDSRAAPKTPGRLELPCTRVAGACLASRPRCQAGPVLAARGGTRTRIRRCMDAITGMLRPAASMVSSRSCVCDPEPGRGRTTRTESNRCVPDNRAAPARDEMDPVGVAPTMTSPLLLPALPHRREVHVLTSCYGPKDVEAVRSLRRDADGWSRTTTAGGDAVTAR